MDTTAEQKTVRTPGFQAFDRLMEQFQPEHRLVFGGDAIHPVG